MSASPLSDELPQRLLVLLRPDDAEPQRLVEHGERLARGLGCPWAVAALAPAGAAATVLDGARDAARRAGAALLPIEPGGADLTTALAAIARRAEADIVLAGPPADPGQHAGFRRALTQALPWAVLHLPGLDERRVQTQPAWREQLLQGWRDAPVVVAALALCTLMGLALQGSHEPSTLIMVYLGGVVTIALRRGQPAALLTVFGSVLLYDLIFVVRRGSGLPGPHNHLLVSLVLMAVGLLISQLAAQIRAQTAAAVARERRTRALNQLAQALAQARTTPAIERALAQAVHRSLQAAAVLLPDRGPDPAPEPAGSRRVPLLAGGTRLGVLDVQLLRPEHDSPEDRALLEGFASQGAIALERALFEQRSASAAIEAERERLRSTLLTGISHDFRTPLTTIVGSTTSLLEQSHAINDEQRTALLHGVLSEARRLHALTSNLLDLARMQEGTIRPTLEWCPADELVAEALQAVTPSRTGRPVQVSVDPDLVVWCDPRLIGQALVNLLDNAAHHAGPGAQVGIRVGAGDGWWRLEVHDDGPGIPPGLEREVFKKFVRGPATGSSTTGTTGTGLGLAICAAVAELHGGRIDAIPGPGARIELTLPQPPQPPTSAGLETLT